MTDQIETDMLKEIEEIKEMCSEWGSFGETFFRLLLGKLSKTTQENYETKKKKKNS